MESDKICVYCGGTYEDDDHVPPQCLFPKPRPSDLITVPSCRQCNRRWGLDDEYLRDVLALGTMDGPVMPELQPIHEAMRRSLARTKFRPPARALLDTSRVEWVQVGSPILQRGYVARIDATRIKRVICRIVRGLHYHESRRLMPLSNDIAVVLGNKMRSLASWDKPLMRETVRSIRNGQWRAIGRTFGYAFTLAHDEPDSGGWFLSFYGRATFFCLVTKD
jgi:hypothetical protein